MQGWISLHRQLQNNWVWQDKPFSRGQAWIDILLMVNHKDNKILLGTELVEVERGSRVTSIRKLCDRWGWSNTKVRAFLKLLEDDNMLIVKSDSKKTTLTVVNYSNYQNSNDTKNDTETTQKHTNNNDNNENNANKDHDGDFSEMASYYQSNLGLLTPAIGEKLKSLSNDFPSDWILEAMDIAVTQNARNLGYVTGILNRWETEGKGNKKKTKSNDGVLGLIDYESPLGEREAEW